MKWSKRVDLMADITQEEIDIYKKGSTHCIQKETYLADIYDEENSDFIMAKQTNTMIIILKGNIPFNYNNILLMKSVIKGYLFNNQNISKIHVIVSPKIPYTSILSFLTVAAPMLYKYIGRKIIIHNYNIYKDITKKAPSILKALPESIKKKIIIDGNKYFYIENLSFIYKTIDGLYVLTMKRRNKCD